MTVAKTTDKQQKRIVGRPFDKNDPRINRKGRPHVPKDMRELNALLDEIFAEEISVTDKGERMTKLRAALNRLLLGKNPSGAIHVLERRYGKIPQAVDVNMPNTIMVNIIRASDDKENADDSDQ